MNQGSFRSDRPPPARYVAASNIIRLTVEELVMVHLQRQPAPEVGTWQPEALTQQGIAAAVGKGRSHVGLILQGLVAKDRVKEWLDHVEGKTRRRKVYRLTGEGRERARGLVSQLYATEVELFDGRQWRKSRLEAVNRELGTHYSPLELYLGLQSEEWLRPPDAWATPAVPPPAWPPLPPSSGGPASASSSLSTGAASAGPAPLPARPEVPGPASPPPPGPEGRAPAPSLLPGVGAPGWRGETWYPHWWGHGAPPPYPSYYPYPYFPSRRKTLTAAERLLRCRWYSAVGLGLMVLTISIMEVGAAFAEELCIMGSLMLLAGIASLLVAIGYAPSEMGAGRQYRMINSVAIMGSFLYFYYFVRWEGEVAVTGALLLAGGVVGVAAVGRYVEEIPPVIRLTLGLLAGLMLVASEVLLVLLRGPGLHEPWLLGPLAGLLLLFWVNEEFEPSPVRRWEALSIAVGLTVVLLAIETAWLTRPSWPGMVLLAGWAGVGGACLWLRGERERGRLLLRPAALLGVAVVLVACGLLLAAIGSYTLALVEGAMAAVLLYYGFPRGLPQREWLPLGYLLALVIVTLGYLYYAL